MSPAPALAPPRPAAEHARAVLALGLPLVGSHLAQMALHVADTVMVGRYGVTELAAVVLGSSTFFIIFILGAGFAQAVMPLVAAAAAARDETQARRDTRMGLWLSVAFGVAIYPLFWLSGPLLAALGQKPEVVALGETYLRIVGLGMIPALWVMVLKSFLAALERAQIGLWVTLGGLALNVLLNWLLIFGAAGFPELGVAGAAIATVLVQAATCAALAAYAALLPALRPYRLFQRLWRPDGAAARRVFRLGLPIGLTSLAEGGLFQASALMMGMIGTVELATHGIAMQSASITFMVHVGLSNAATVRAGQALGRGDARDLRDGARVAVLMSLAFSLFTVALFLAVPETLIRLFLAPDEPQAAEILAFGVVLLALAALFQVADAMQVMALGLLRGIQDTRVPMWIAVFSYWAVGVPMSWLLAFRLGQGGAGLWLGLVIGLVVAASLLMTRFWLRAPRPA
jgi:MATE family multidrug resistance protein